MYRRVHLLFFALRAGLLLLALLVGLLSFAAARPAAALYVAPTGPTKILAAGNLHTCALQPSGAADCWGNDSNGQAGDAEEHPGPYTQLAAGHWHTCGLTATGAADCWGDDRQGQVGGPGEHPGPYTQLAAGGSHTCGLTATGAADCWGYDSDGQAGDAEEHPGPYTQITAALYHTCALTPTGAADCWGDDFGGQAGDAARNPGPYGPYRPAALPELITAGAYHTCGLIPAGAADCWGNDGNSQAGRAARNPGPYIQLAAGLWRTCGLTPTGAADCWGDDGQGQAGGAARKPGPYTLLAAGGHHTCGLTPDGAADCWGRNGDGQAGGAEEHPGPYGPYDPTAVTEPTVYLSTTTTGTTADGVAFDNTDILKWDGEAWSVWFDGSAAFLDSGNKPKHNTNALWIDDEESAVMSFAQQRRFVPGISFPVDGTDLVRWDGSAFSFWFDGSDVGLDKKGPENIDGLHVLDGSESPIGAGCAAYLLVSTQGPGKVPNHSGGTLKFGGEDVLGFCATNLGEATTGLWHMVLDGSAKGLPRNIIDSISADEDGQTIYFTTSKQINLGGISGGPSAVFVYDLTTGNFSGPHFVAADYDLNSKVDGLDWVVEE